MTNIKKWYFYTEQNEEFIINGLGIKEKMILREIYRPSGTGDYLLMFFQQPMICGTPKKTYNMKKPSMIFWNNHMGHMYSCDLKEWTHSWIHFNGTDVKNIITNLNLKPGIPYEYSNDKVNFWIEELVIQMAKEKINYRLIRSIFKTFLLLINSELQDQEQIKVDTVDLVKNYLIEHHHRKIDLKMLSERFNISVPHLCDCYKKKYKTTIIRDLRTIRMISACHVMLDKNLSLSQVANLVGYKDIYHFSKEFKKEFGTTPKDKRKEMWDKKPNAPE